jgi:hypothetical protein
VPLPSIAWQMIRVPVLALLILFEPLVRLLLYGLGLLGAVTALVIELAARPPHFPFWGTLAASVACVVLLGAYHAIIHCLSQR